VRDSEGGREGERREDLSFKTKAKKLSLRTSPRSNIIVWSEVQMICIWSI